MKRNLLARNPYIHTKMPPRVTLSDIAKEARVAVSTVSHALRDEAFISAPQRERIQKLADAMGYRRDPML